MKKVIGVLTLVLALTLGASAQKHKTDEVSFASSVKCGMCKKTVESNLGKEKGVQAVNVDLKDHTINVVYNPKKVSKDELKDKISKIGYDADEVVADQKAHDALPGCCQKTAKAHKD
ncbi:MAG: heavy-metal-associated domain-containing protein [Leadbetterella sp.]|nr:heavy-metal-associated domain-containing protein [Leadbetterella sp.]